MSTSFQSWALSGGMMTNVPLPSCSQSADTAHFLYLTDGHTDPVLCGSLDDKKCWVAGGTPRL